MIPILLVEDEYLIRELIKASIDWNGCGFEIVEEAEDGEEALLLLENSKAQLLLVDINIPIMDGMQLTRLVKEKYPNKQIIIITGYSEFEYAKTALELGVSNYMLKPIDPEELQGCLRKVKAEIEKRHYIHNLEDKVKSGFEMHKSAFLASILQNANHFSKEQIEESLQTYQIDLDPVQLQVIVIEIDYMTYKWMNEKERRLWQFATKNVADEIFGKQFTYVSHIGSLNHIVYVINNKDETRLKQVCEEVLNKVKFYLKYTVTIGIGLRYEGYEQIHRSYQDALLALENKFTMGANQVLDAYVSPVFSSNSIVDAPLMFNKEAFIIAIKMGRNDLCHNQIDDVFSQMVGDALSKEVVKQISLDILMAIMKVVAENQVMLPDLFSCHHDYFTFIRSRETIEDIRLTLLMLVEAVVQHSTHNRSKNTVFIDRAREYIEQHYAKSDLSLEEISSYVSISSAYMSTIFKKEMGVGMTEYITEIRLKKAKELIDLHGETSIQDIALNVGYMDAYYFSKCFKKRFGISPKNYSVH
ncbi:response regulator [Paenibacillus roseipurpureus]|uniref:Response regulator n=1 Tax=Paenibacillus roseopurpureus TaxID=2918901 RepID=A0AA96RH29_9BACL|nr:response regulator [Paenibacillus sp. MBLB1832]WNR42858.1 response regulator [Paenibacillus sp. MBLB1832]